MRNKKKWFASVMVASVAFMSVSALAGKGFVSSAAEMRLSSEEFGPTVGISEPPAAPVNMIDEAPVAPSLANDAIEESDNVTALNEAPEIPQEELDISYNTQKKAKEVEYVISEDVCADALTDIVKKNTGCNTTEELKECIIETSRKYTFDDATVTICDVSKKNPKDEIPEEGMFVLLPYPDGVDKDVSDFWVIHLNIETGKFERITPVKTDSGIKVKVTNFSPFAIAYRNLGELNDVDKKSYYYSYVRYVYSRGYMVGKVINADGSREFDPRGEISRAEFVQMLYSVSEKPIVGYKNLFEDVPKGQWYTSAVMWGINNDIVKGKGNIFDPGESLTREELAYILYSYAKISSVRIDRLGNLKDFADYAEVSDWAVRGMRWAIGNELIKGKGDAGEKLYLDPKACTTRAECAVIIRNFVENLLKNN